MSWLPLKIVASPDPKKCPVSIPDPSAAKAITEGRDAVHGLRASTLERNDLAAEIRTLGDELATRGAPTSSRIQC